MPCINAASRAGLPRLQHLERLTDPSLTGLLALGLGDPHGILLAVGECELLERLCRSGARLPAPRAATWSSVRMIAVAGPKGSRVVVIVRSPITSA